MNRYLLSALGVMFLCSTLLVGCESSPTSGGTREYTPNAKPTQLAAYAASMPYPANLNAQDNPDLVALVNKSTGNITLMNLGPQPLRDFNLWVNQSYLLHVDRVDPNTGRIISKTDLYNSAGNNMENATPESVRRLQVQTGDGALYNVKGPVLM